MTFPSSLRPSDIDWANLPPQGWILDGKGGMRRSKLARLRTWLWWFSGTKLGALLYVLLGVCAVQRQEKIRQAERTKLVAMAELKKGWKA
jgi:hypothetical protein